MTLGRRDKAHRNKGRMDFEQVDVLGVSYAVVDYESASSIIVEHAEQHESFGVSALAVHGLITTKQDPEMKLAVSRMHMCVPDGQPVRWAMNYLHKTGLRDRVYGPKLTLHVLEKTDQKGLNVYLYGSTPDTIRDFSKFISKNFPGITICGTHADRFREATPEEDREDIEKIIASDAHVVLVGRGCPRQEKWVADHIDKIPAAMMAVGAAFNFHAGNLKQAPGWIQDYGLEWLFRLVQEPRRLWRRYLVTNSYFIYLFTKQALSQPTSRSR